MQRSGDLSATSVASHDVRGPDLAGGRDRAMEKTDLGILRVEQRFHYVTQPWNLGHLPESDLMCLHFLAYRK